MFWVSSLTADCGEVSHSTYTKPGGYDVYRKSLAPAVKTGTQWPVTEPLSVVPAMAAVTKNLGFGVTVSTTYEQPYHLARRLSTIDHLTNGRSVFSNIRMLWWHSLTLLQSIDSVGT